MGKRRKGVAGRLAALLSAGILAAGVALLAAGSLAAGLARAQPGAGPGSPAAPAGPAAPRTATGGGVVVGPDGSVYVVGHAAGAGTGASRGDIDVVIAKHDPSGGRLWARRFGSDRYDEARDLAVDASGNLLVVGVTEGGLATAQGAAAMTEGGLVMTEGGLAGQRPAAAEAPPPAEAFLAKFDREGELLWARQFGGKGRHAAAGVAADGEGNAFVVGWVATPGEGRVSLRGPEITHTAAFLAKFDANGARLWLRPVAVDAEQTANAVTVTPAGEVLVAGAASEVPFVVAPVMSAFVSRFGADGEELGLVRFPTRGGGEIARDVAGGADGSVYTVGETGGPFGTEEQGPAERPGVSVDAFVARHDPGGGLLWARRFGSGRGYSGQGVAVDGRGGAVVVGTGNGDLGGEPLGLSDVFVARYAADGERLWADRLGTPEFDDAFGVALGEDGLIFVAGALGRGWADPYGRELFLAAYAPNGERLWLKRWEGGPGWPPPPARTP